MLCCYVASASLYDMGGWSRSNRGVMRQFQGVYARSTPHIIEALLLLRLFVERFAAVPSSGLIETNLFYTY